MRFSSPGTIATLVFDTNFHTISPIGDPSCEAFKRDMGWVKTAKNPDVRPINRYISETIKHRHSHNGRLIGSRIWT